MVGKLKPSFPYPFNFSILQKVVATRPSLTVQLASVQMTIIRLKAVPSETIIIRMFFNISDLENEIRELHQKSSDKRKLFDEGMKNGMSFDDLKVLFSEIKEIEKRLELCFEEAEVQKRFS